MSTTITNVTELQAMEDDLTEDYVLGNNIDASATSSWNGGLGFVPIGAINRVSNSRPWDDDFGYAGQSGSWTIYPSDGVYYDKVDEATSDGDSTYIQATSHGAYCLLAHDATALNIPNGAFNIAVVIRSYVRNTSSGTSYIQGMLNIDGVEYLVGSNSAVSSQSYALYQWTMNVYPPDSSAWAPADVFNLAVQGVGVKVSDALPNLRITQLYILVDYDVKFAGTFDGAGYTISDLYINRPTEDRAGLFGYTDGATIQDVALTDATITGDDRAGALIGDADDTTVSEVIVTNTTITASDDYGGGLVGDADTCIVSKCSVSGSVTGGDNYVGGLIGLSYRSDIDNCYARDGVDGDRYIGGLIGYSYDSVETIDDCYSTGAVTGNNDVGGLLGYSESVVSNCFWDTETSGQASSAAGTGKTTTEMKTLATFDDVGWDIGGTGVNRNDGYPFLHWESGGAVPIWQIYDTSTRSFTIPDLLDYHGIAVKNANVEAYRVDTHAFVEAQITDANGSATFTGLPNDVDAVFRAAWGGSSKH